MMYKNMTMKYFKLLAFVIVSSVLGLSGCKSPIDLDNDVKEVPIQTKPVELSSMRVSVDGGGRSMRFIPNSPPEETRFSFKGFTIEQAHIDTTDRSKLKLAMRFGITTDIPDSSRFEEVMPKLLSCEFDTVMVPIFDNPPSPREKLGILLKKSKLYTYIFSKRKDGPSGFRIIKSEKEFDLLDDTDGYNHTDTYVYAIRTRAVNSKPIISLIIESGFSLNGVEIDSFDKNFRTNTSGKSIIKITF